MSNTNKFDSEDYEEVIDSTNQSPKSRPESTNAEFGEPKNETMPSSPEDNLNNAPATNNWIIEVGQEHLVALVKKMNEEWEDKFRVGATFDSTASVYDAATAFAAKYNMAMVTANHNVGKKIFLTCKHGGQFRSHKKGENRNDTANDGGESEEKQVKKKRNKKSMKTNCPCLIAASYDSNSLKVVIRQSVFMHNHPLAEDPRTYAVNRTLDVGEFEVARSLLQKVTPAAVLQVMSDVVGVKNATKKDFENMQQHFKPSDEMSPLVINLQEKGYEVRYHANSDGVINAIFFIHDHAISDLRRLPECIVVDATYKTNKHKLALLNFAVASTVASKEHPKQLATIPIAECWMNRETTQNYTWALRQLRNVVWSSGSMDAELPDVFVTDNEAALRRAILEVFPESTNLLCYVHIMANFEKRFLETIKGDLGFLNEGEKDESTDTKDDTVPKDVDSDLEEDDIETVIEIDDEVIDHEVLRKRFRNIIYEIACKCMTEKHFEKLKLKYTNFVTKNGYFEDDGKVCLDYFEKMLLEKEHWVGFYANKHLHMNNRTSNRAESTHSAMKFHIGSSTSKLARVTAKIDQWYRIREDYRAFQMERERLTLEVSVIESEVFKYLKPLVNKITSFAMVKIKNQLTKGLVLEENGQLYKNECTCFVKAAWRLPCKHQLVECKKEFGAINLDTVHPRWRIWTSKDKQENNCSNKPEETPDSTYSNHSSESFQDDINQKFTFQFNDVFNKFQSLFQGTAPYQDKQNMLDELESLYEKLSGSGAENLKKIPVVGSSRGRPKREKRDRVGVEWAKVNLSQRTSKTQATAKNKKRNNSDVDGSQADKESSKKHKTESDNINSSVKNDTFDDDDGCSVIDLAEADNKFDFEDENISFFEEPTTKNEPAGEVKNAYAKQYNKKATPVFSDEYKKLLSQINDAIPSDCFTCLINVGSDGFCGFRALAYQIYGNEKEFWRVKQDLRDTLLKNENHYRDHFYRFFSVDALLEVVCFGIGNTLGSTYIDSSIVMAPLEYWFISPDCAQLAADTYQVPLAVFVEKTYGDMNNFTYLPLLSQDLTAVTVKNLSKSPLLLQRVNQNHWVTLIMRRAIKMVWPLPNLSMYKVASESMKQNPDFKQSPWNRSMIFAKQKKDKDASDAAETTSLSE